MQYSPPPPKPDRARLTGHLRVYHERFEEDPVEINLSMSDACDCGDEEYFERKYKVNEKPITIDLPFDRLDTLVIKNIRGSSYKKNPTPEEAEDDRTHVVYVSFDGGETWPHKVSPRRFCILEPTDEVNQITLRTDETKNTEVRVYAIP